MRKLICIMVSFNRIDKLPIAVEECLANGADHIIIIDNNSTSDVTDYLLSIKDNMKLSVIFNKVNVGASLAFRQGVEYLPKVCDLDKSDVVFLDDDSYLSEKFKKKLVYDVDFISPKVINTNGRRLKMNLPLLTIPSSFVDVLKYLFKRPIPEANHEVKIVSASFVGLTMKASLAYESRYLIPDDFFIYFDDVYFTTKLTNNGKQGKYIPKLEIIHDTTDVKRISSNITIYYLFRNAVITHKYMSSKWWWIIIFFKMLMYLFLIAKRSKNKISHIKCLFSGILSGMKVVNGN